MEAIIAALITGACSIVVVLIANRRSQTVIMAELEKHQAVTDTKMEERQAATNEKIEELTREVREHNKFARRMPVVEEQVKVINHRLNDLEDYHK